MRKCLALLLCALLLAGCAVEEQVYVPTGNGLSDLQVTQPIGSDVTLQEVRLPYYPEESLNPYLCGDYTNRTLFGLLYQSLFVVDENYQADPILCSDYTVSRDLKTYTFRLENASFSDGTALTGEDVVASLRAAMESGYYSGRFSNVETLQAVEKGVEITLTTPCEDLAVLLDVPIVKADQTNMERPLGTGPYFYETVDGLLGLRRRSDWWCAAVLPVTAQRISLVEVDSPAQLRDEFEFSRLSMMTANPGSEGYAQVHSEHELWESENGSFLYLGCNTESYVLSQGTIRQNLTYAIGRDTIVEELYRGFAYAAVLPASPQSPHYSASLASTVTYAPEKLTEAVANANLETNELILLVNNDDGVRLRAARNIAASLNECGLAVTVSALITQDYLTALQEGEFDLYLGQTRLSANMDLSAFFAPEGALSLGGISDPVTYALCLESLANRGNYYTLHQNILESGVICPILFRSYAIFARRGVFQDLSPARDYLFYYTLGKNPDSVRLEEK